MSKLKKDVKEQESLEEIELEASGVKPEDNRGRRDLYQVVVVNHDRNEELTPIMLTMANSDLEAESIIRHKLSLDWQKERLDFFVKLFKE